MTTTAGDVQSAGMSGVYREPTPKDLPDIAMIDGQAFRDSRYPFFVLKQLLEAHSERSVVAVETDENGEEKVVGYALTIGEGKRAWLISLAVSPDRRGRGHGERLLRRSVELCQEKPDVDEVRLTVDPKNEHAYHLFKNFGFQFHEHDERYFGDNEPRDVLIFTLRDRAAELPVDGHENGYAGP
ncbi:N-acetyltransferase [Nocardia sp. NPDC051832]|uniref:GNAT family N-acetyltransferase n=1 Tax=Nocardia sp. NPDC051832 TaxID=3155673 RepID=UPI00341F6AC8